MWAKNWKGETVDPGWLLGRYAMTVTPGNGRHVVGLQETSGRAQLRNVVIDTEDPVRFLWTWTPGGPNPPLDEATKMEWHDVLMDHENQLNLVVNNHSYYWPRAGQKGAHIVTPKDGGDTVSGWGLAQDLPDQPTDNRYMTLIVYWGMDGGTPIPDPDPDPGPVDPPAPPPPGILRPTGRLYGIHAPKDMMGEDDWNKWKAINPGVVLMTNPNMSPEAVTRVRREAPGVIVIGRFFGSPEVNAWRPPYWDSAVMYRYGVFCRTEAERIGLDIAVFSNEPGIDDPNQEGSEERYGAFWWTREGYQTLAHGYRAFAQGWRSVGGKCLLGTIPLSPGHHEYDDPDRQGWKGADFLAPAYDEFADVFVSHDYYHRGQGSETEQWFGGTLFLKLAAYNWPATKPVVNTEWNRDEPEGAPFGDAEKEQDVGQSERFLEQYRAVPYFLGACRFIWRSDSFPRLSWHDNDRQRQLAARINHKGGTMPDPLRTVEVQISVTEQGLAVRGKPMRLVIHTSRKDNGQPVPAGSLITTILNYTRITVNGVDTAPVPADVKVWRADSGGKTVAEINIDPGAVPSSEATEGAHLKIAVLGLADLVGYDEQMIGETVIPIEILKDMPVNPPPGPNPDQPGPTPTPSGQSLWGYLVLIHNRTGDVDNLMQQGKIEEARTLNVQQQATVAEIKRLLGFP